MTAAAEGPAVVRPEITGPEVPLRLGIVLPDEDPGVDPRRIVDLARRAEDLGLAAVWLPDHLVPPGPFGPVYGGAFEALTLLAHIGAVTERVTLGTSVVILPLRDPFLLAKQTATLERLAPGRFVLGVGVGWEQAEFTTLQVPFTERGARTDEALDLIRQLHAGGPAAFAGRFFQADGGHVAPRPTAPVPVLVGGTSPAALRRAVLRGDLWQAYGLSPEQFADHVARLGRLADELPGARRVSPGAALSFTGVPGGTDGLARHVRAWQQAGAEHLAVHFGSLEGAAERMVALARRLPDLLS